MTPSQFLMASLVASGALALFYPWLAAVCAALLVWLFKGDARAMATKLLAEDSPYLLIGFVSLTGLLALVRNNIPSDDLLRHVVSYAYGYQHTAMYPNSTLPSFNLYPLFDQGLGLVSQGVSPFVSIALALILAWSLALHLLYRLAALGIPDGTADRYLKLTLIMGLCLATPLSGRLFLGRPEVLVILWACHALLVTNNRGLLLWIIGGLLSISGYWLAFLVFPLAVVLPFSWQKRTCVLVMLSAAHAGFWLWHTEGAYLEAIRLIPQWTANRLISVTETESVFQLFFDPAFFSLAGLAAFAQHQEKPRSANRGVFAILGLFFILGMVRYVSILSVLLLYLALPAVRNWQVPKHALVRLMLLAAPFFLANQVIQHSATYAQTPRFELPPGSRVLTEFGQATFATPLFNPGRVTVLPAMELGASPKEIQLLVKALMNGKAVCGGWQAQGVTHVIESRLVEIPPCATLKAVQGSWRLWEVQVTHD